MTTYTVRAKRWKHGWELHIDGVGVTQSRSLGDAKTMVRDYIETLTDADASVDEIIITPEVGNGLDELARKAREAVAAAERARHEAAVQSRQVAIRLKEAGLSGRDISEVLNVSAQRVSQLLRSATDRVLTTVDQRVDHGHSRPVSADRKRTLSSSARSRRSPRDRV